MVQKIRVQETPEATEWQVRAISFYQWLQIRTIRAYFMDLARRLGSDINALLFLQ